MSDNIKSKKKIGDLIPKSDGTMDLNLSNKFIKTLTSIYGTKADNLSTKPKSGGRRLGNLDTAKNTSITENQYKRMRRGDGTADVLAHLYVMLKKNNDQLKKQREINNNFKKQREHEKAALHKSSRNKGSTGTRKQRKHDSEESEFNYWTLLGLGIATAVAGLVDVFNIDGSTLQEFHDKLTGWVEKSKEVIDTGIEKTKEWYTIIKDDFDLGVKTFGNDISTFYTKIGAQWASLVETFTKFKDYIVSGITKKFEEIMKTVDWVVESGKNLKTLVSSHWESLKTWLSEMAKNPKALFQGGFSDLFNSVGANSSAYNDAQRETDSKHPQGGLVNAMFDANSEIGSAMESAPGKLWDMAKEGYNASDQAGKAAISGVTSAAEWYIGGAKENWGEKFDYWNKETSAGGDTYEFAKRIKDQNKDRIMPWTAISTARGVAIDMAKDKFSKSAEATSESARKFVETPGAPTLGLDYSQSSEVDTEYNKTRMQALLKHDYVNSWGQNSGKTISVDNSSSNAKNMGPNIPTDISTRNNEKSLQQSTVTRSKTGH